MADVTEKLERLAGLLEKGLITREQFEKERDALFAADRSPTPRSSSPNVGDSVGAYRILGELGRGGMGVVYRGKHRTAAIAKRQGGEVAIKVLHAQYAQDEVFRDRFEREASMGLKLDHPGIIRVYDLVIDGGNLALVMDLAEGRPLSEVIGQETGPIPWERAWPMFKQMLDAVAYAHEHKVVHRDIKPENVIVSPKGKLKVLDFGIAKDMEGGKTKTGTGMGTVDYMAPEQYTDAKSVDQRADIYALGMTLYEMLAGRLPWESSASEFQVMTLKSKGDFPPPTAFYPEIPEGVVAVVERATALEIGQRYSSVKALHSALEEAIRRGKEEAEAAREEEQRQKAAKASAAKAAREEEQRQKAAKLADAASVEPVVSNTDQPSRAPVAQPAARTRLGFVLLLVVLLGSVAGGVLYLNREVEMPPEMLRALEIDLQQGLWGTDAEVEALLGSACDAGYEPACIWREDRTALPTKAPSDLRRLEHAHTVFRAMDMDRDVSLLVSGWLHSQMLPGGTPSAVARSPELAYQLFGRACDEGLLRACVEKGRLLAFGAGVAEDHAQAVVYYRQACEGGDTRGCGGLGLKHLNGSGVAQDAVQAMVYFRQACAGGSALYCDLLGTFYRTGAHVAEDDAQAVVYYRQACEGGNMIGCFNLGEMYARGEGVAEDDAQAVVYYRQACEGGNMRGCSNLGVMYDNGEGVAKDDAQAVALYRQACEGGNMGGCGNLGVKYANGEGVAKDAAQAVVYYRQACNGGEMLGCYNLGLMYANGLGVAKDDAQAAVYYRQACNGGNMRGCSNLGFMYGSGEGVAKDAAQAVAYYRQACEGGNMGGCYNLGVMYAYGSGVAKDAAQAAVYYRQACNGGYAPACN
jgi:TPR repeat protein